MKISSPCALAIASVAAFSALWPANAQNPHPALPRLQVPQGAGINIHFTEARPGEMEMLAAAFRVARMDFSWGATEREKGVYDFSAYDRLLQSCDANKVRALFILDYNNPFYDDGLSPRDTETAAPRWALGCRRCHAFPGARRVVGDV